MKYQIIVSVMPLGMFPDGEAPVRPFGWVSTTDEQIADIIDKLKKHSIRDMRFTVDEAETMGVHVLKAFQSSYKAVALPFNQYEMLSIAILDEDEIAAREKEVWDLMLRTVQPGESTH